MLSKRLPNIAALRVFAVAARHGSFVAAAQELHVTHGAVSKQVQTLESDLGVRLFERRNRGVYLTDQGTWLASRLAPLFTGLERTMRDFDALDVPTTLTISCEPTLCLKLLIPLLADFRQSTGIDVRVLAAGGTVDFRRDHVDLAIRRNDFPLPAGTVSTIIGREWMGCVHSPQSATRDRLHSVSRPNAWQTWDAAGLAGPTDVENRHFEHFYMALQAAEAGHGVALASVHMVARDLDSGRLVAPHGFRRDGTDYIAMHAAGRTDPHFAVAIAWIADKLADNVARWIDPAEIGDTLV